jgi:putative endonuclease
MIRNQLGRNAETLSPQPEGATADYLELGRSGEQLATEFLEGSGYRLVASNFSIPVGRNTRGVTVNAEIDVVAYDETTLCFIEVKTRRSDWFAPPEANVDLRKQRQVTRAARAYRRVLGLEGCEYRFDVVSVILPEALAQARPRIQLMKNFWTEDKFKKRAWEPRG